MTQNKKEKVMSLPRHGTTTTKKSASSFLKGFCSTQFPKSIFTVSLSPSVNTKSPHCLHVKPAELLRQMHKQLLFCYYSHSNSLSLDLFFLKYHWI